MGNWGDFQFITFCHFFILIHFPCFSMDFSQRRQSFVNISNMSLSHGLLLFPNCSSLGPLHGVMNPTSKPSTTRGPLFLCPQVLPTNLLWHRSTGSQPLSGIHLLRYEVLQRLQVDICFTLILHGLQEHICFTIVCTTDCRGISAVMPGAPLSPLSSLNMESAELFVSHVLIPLLQMMLGCSIFPLLKYVVPEALHCCWWAQLWPVALTPLPVASGIYSIGCRESFWQHLVGSYRQQSRDLKHSEWWTITLILACLILSREEVVKIWLKSSSIWKTDTSCKEFFFYSAHVVEIMSLYCTD